MGRQHLPSKKHLGQHLDRRTLEVSRQLARTFGQKAAEGQPEAGVGAYWPNAPHGGVPEASVIEDLAVYDGADVLFAAGREGPITALAIILIPEENRQNRRIAALAANFGFVAHLSRKRKIAVAVPEGYVTDFASIPGFVQWLISPFGRHSEAAVIHDWLYTLGTPGDAKGRKIADRTFRRALKLVGVGWVRRSLMYRAVRLGGRSGYGLTTDYDFRDLVQLKRREPLPDKSVFAATYREADIPITRKAKLKNAKAEPASATMTQDEARQEMQDSSIAVESR